MKTKIFFLVCLFIGLALPRLYAQMPLPPNGNTGTSSWYEEWDSYSIPVVIDGEVVDELYGTVNIHNVVFMKNGEWIKGSQHMVGEVTSSVPPYEVFKVSDMSHFYYADESYGFKVHLVGNQGTRYILDLLYDTVTYEITAVRTHVTGKPK